MVHAYETIASYLSSKTSYRPEVGIICGSGLSGLSKSLENSETFKYEDIPGFAAATVAGHIGELVFGTIGSIECVCMRGRFHYYEVRSQWLYPIYNIAFTYTRPPPPPPTQGQRNGSGNTPSPSNASNGCQTIDCDECRGWFKSDLQCRRYDGDSGSFWPGKFIVYIVYIVYIVCIVCIGCIGCIGCILASLSMSLSLSLSLSYCLFLL